MIAGIYYARKKYKERQAAKAEAAGAAAAPSSGDEVQHEAATPAPAAEITPGATENGLLVDGQQPNALAATPEAKAKKLEPTPEQKAEKKRRRIYRAKILFGTMLPFALQALDMTIVASALPFIAMSFNEVSQLNWIISAYNLTSAAFLPFWAQITDIFGRHATLQGTLLLMLVGSAICTGAPTSTFGVLLLGRALQGIAAAGIGISVRTILADKVSLKDYAVNWTLFALLNGITFSIGPLIGGFLTQDSWRWCFAINLPVGVAGIIVAWLLLRKDLLGPQPLPELDDEQHGHTHHGRLFLRLSTIDYGGQLLFLWGLGLLILAFTWAGGAYNWDTANVLAPLVVGAVLAVAWIVYEYSMAPPHVLSRVFSRQRAMIRWELLTQRDVGLLLYINFCVGAGMFAVMYFMDLYFALVQGQSASKSGENLLYFLPGLGVGGYGAMFASNIYPRQTMPSLLLGSIATAVGITVLAFATYNEQNNLIYGMMALVGFGIGLRLNPGSMHALAYFPTLTAQITCLVAFAVPFGGTVILTVMSTVFNNKSGATHEDAKSGVKWAFVAVIPFMWLAVIACLFLGNVWIAKEGDGHEVTNSPWLISLLLGRPVVREKRTRGNLDQAYADTADTPEQKAEKTASPEAEGV